MNSTGCLVLGAASPVSRSSSELRTVVLRRLDPQFNPFLGETARVQQIDRLVRYVYKAPT